MSEQASDRERAEALAWIRADLRTLYRMGSEQRQNLSDLTRRLDENARQIADLIEGNGLRDLLAEAKADAWDEGFDEGADDIFGLRSNNPYRDRA